MKVFKTIPWEHDGKEYDIRIMFDDRLINILPFYNNHPANGFRYQMQLSKNIQVRDILKIENFEPTIEDIKEDIINDRWKHFSK